MSLQFDQLNNQLKTNDSTNANASMVLTPAGTGSVQVTSSGTNLLIYSNTFTNAAWATSNSTIATTAATTDPIGGSNAYIVTATSTAAVGLGQGITPSTGVYNFSIYAKAGTSTWLRLFNSTTIFAYFNLSAGTVGTVYAGSTAAITSVGNGWYRCSVSSVSTGAVGVRLADGDNNTVATSGTTLYIYGSQCEIGSFTSTYVPTTTTAIYNAPVLSFSGVASIGLQSDGSMYVQPAGTGALQAQATTSTATGGNARGVNAVDLQTSRNAAGQVASGTNSVVVGGTGTSAQGAYSFAGSGLYSGSNGYGSFVGSGYLNVTSAPYSVIGAGQSNSIGGNGFNSAIVSGSTNTASGPYNFIGAGFTNLGTSGSAVTTQSGTMNGTTAVTLSGSNASIKVGQYIAGTSIAGDTYVAAISGTSLTLSKVASGSSTSTLSFYTPHGVVVGGGNNQATGSYSFIGGGGDAGTAANRNSASADWSTVVGGFNSRATGAGSFVGGGGANGPDFGGNIASGAVSSVVGGFGNNASGEGASILGGYQHSANSRQSVVIGGRRGTTRSISGYAAFPSCENPIADVTGVSQAALLILGRQTTDATPTVLCSNSAAASGTNQVILPNNSAYYFTGEVVSGVTGGGNTKGWTISGLIKRGANAAATTLVGSTVTSLYADAGAATWALALTADTTNGGLAVTFTGQAATTIRTVAQIRTTEMTY